MAGNLVFIVNPRAANGAVGKQWPGLRKKVKDRLGVFATRITKGPGDATRLCREAVLEGADMVICVGGDGTLNEVINGLLDEAGNLLRPVPLAFMPRGTGGDFSKSASIPGDPDRGLDNILGLHVRYVDLGRLTFHHREGRPSYRYFHNVVSFGLGGEVDDRVNKTTKVFGGFFSFIWATLLALLLYNKKIMRVTIDGDFDEEIQAWNVAVANGQYHGGGMRVAPGADLSDGLFQITLIGDLNLAQVFWNLPKLYNGRIYEHPKIKKQEGRRVTASSTETVLLDMDGEQFGRLPVEIDVIPGVLPIICNP